MNRPLPMCRGTMSRRVSAPRYARKGGAPRVASETPESDEHRSSDSNTPDAHSECDGHPQVGSRERGGVIVGVLLVEESLELGL
jgi:hypothetical protein